MAVSLPLQVTSDHALEVPLQAASNSVKVVSGDTVYYADQPYVTSASNQGSITNGNSQSFTTGVWVRSATLSAITVTPSGVGGAAGQAQDIVLGTDGLVGGPGGTALTALGLAGYEWSYTQITSTANVTDTSEATATALISPAAFTPDGGAVLVEFFSPSITTPSLAAGSVTVTLFEGATQIGRLGTVTTPAAANHSEGNTFKYRFTPTNAAHTYKVCAFTSSTTGTPSIGAGAGGTNTLTPAYIRFAKV